MADAYANLKNEAEEFKVYSRLLDLLNAHPHRFVAGPKTVSRGQRDPSSTTPVDASTTPGEADSLAIPSSSEEGSLTAATSSSAMRDRLEAETARLRAVDYSHVLERTVARLTAAKRYLDVVALFRKELERNANEENLYARFAEYLNQHRFFNEEMETYQQAINRFNKASWYAKLARWYLRQKRQADFAALSKRFVDAFAGTELEAYFSDVVTQVRPNAFYEELNVYANRRFPHNPVFARNLADVYLSSSRTYPQWEAIHKDILRRQVHPRALLQLSEPAQAAQPMLAELAAAPERNLAQTRFLADAWPGVRSLSKRCRTTRRWQRAIHRAGNRKHHQRPVTVAGRLRCPAYCGLRHIAPELGAMGSGGSRDADSHRRNLRRHRSLRRRTRRLAAAPCKQCFRPQPAS